MGDEYIFMVAVLDFVHQLNIDVFRSDFDILPPYLHPSSETVIIQTEGESFVPAPNLYEFILIC